MPTRGIAVATYFQVQGWGGRVMRAAGYTYRVKSENLLALRFPWVTCHSKVGWFNWRSLGSPWVEMLATLEISRHRRTYDYMVFHFPLFRGWSWQPAHSKGLWWWLLYCIWPYEDKDVKKSKNPKKAFQITCLRAENCLNPMASSPKRSKASSFSWTAGIQPLVDGCGQDAPWFSVGWFLIS